MTFNSMHKFYVIMIKICQFKWQEENEFEISIYFTWFLEYTKKHLNKWIHLIKGKYYGQNPYKVNRDFFPCKRLFLEIHWL